MYGMGPAGNPHCAAVAALGTAVGFAGVTVCAAGGALVDGVLDAPACCELELTDEAASVFLEPKNKKINNW